MWFKLHGVFYSPKWVQIVHVCKLCDLIALILFQRVLGLQADSDIVARIMFSRQWDSNITNTYEMLLLDTRHRFAKSFSCKNCCHIVAKWCCVDAHLSKENLVIRVNCVHFYGFLHKRSAAVINLVIKRLLLFFKYVFLCLNLNIFNRFLVTSLLFTQLIGTTTFYCYGCIGIAAKLDCLSVIKSTHLFL